MNIQPLSKETLQEAIDLILRCFPESQPDDFDYAGKWLPYSLEQDKEDYVTGLEYWVAIEDAKVIGISGWYTLKEDKNEANWVGWTCVDPKFRGKKIGSKLLDLMIEKTRKQGKKFLRLYTDSYEKEKTARLLYEKRGFVETKREKDKKGDGYTIYMEMKL